MKVIAINGSARKDGNTSILINIVFEELNKEGIETEQIQLAGATLSGCRACYKCFGQKNKHCAQDNDILNELIDKILPAQGLILGSPTYFSDVTANMRAFIERCGLVARANDYMLKGKVGAGVVAVRRAGGIPAFNALNLFFHYMQMVMPGSSYWNVGLGRNIGEVWKDEEGLNTMRDLGKNMAWLMKKLYP
ncbi:MAG: flavodoxin family protein [Syntrophales bacterium]|nr:flavodoxin family protein [Syntrophales bacterium]